MSLEVHSSKAARQAQRLTAKESRDINETINCFLCISATLPLTLCSTGSHVCLAPPPPPRSFSPQVRDYLMSLEVHLSEAARQAQRLAAKEVEVGEALAEFGQSIDKLGRLEEGNVAEAFTQLANKATALADARKVRCQELVGAFEAPLKEAVSGGGGFLGRRGGGGRRAVSGEERGGGRGGRRGKGGERGGTVSGRGGVEGEGGEWGLRDERGGRGQFWGGGERKGEGPRGR